MDFEKLNQKLSFRYPLVYPLAKLPVIPVGLPVVAAEGHGLGQLRGTVSEVGQTIGPRGADEQSRRFVRVSKGKAIRGAFTVEAFLMDLSRPAMDLNNWPERMDAFPFAREILARSLYLRTVDGVYWALLSKDYSDRGCPPDTWGLMIPGDVVWFSPTGAPLVSAPKKRVFKVPGLADLGASAFAFTDYGARVALTMALDEHVWPSRLGSGGG